MATVNYTINSTTGDDWTGVITVSDLNAQVKLSTPTSITAVGGHSFTPAANFGMYPGELGANQEYITWRNDTTLSYGQYPNSGKSFDVWSSDLYDDVNGGFTWNQLISAAAYNLTSNKNTVYYDYDIPSQIYWGRGGTIDFTS